MLIITEKKPQCMFCEGTIWHGPSFKNLAMPNDPERTEMENVVMNMMNLGIPRKLTSSLDPLPKNRTLFLMTSANRIMTVGTAST